MSEMHNNGQEQEIATIYCVNCGCGLNEEEGVLASPDWYEDTRFVHYCRDCQQKQFEDFAEDTSPAFAYFLCCAAYNLPFIPECMPNGAYDVDEITWIMYLENLETSEYRYKDDGEPAAFVDGMTDISVLFGGKIDARTKFAAGATMEGTSAKLPGTKAQRRKWGILSDYTTEDYILMLNASGLPCTYASKAEDHDTVIPERITYANLSAPFKFEDGTEVSVDVTTMLAASVEAANNRAESAETKCSNLEKENEALNAKVKAMNEAEDKRRIKAAKEVIEKAISEADACHMELSEDARKQLMDAVEAGCYNTVLNEAGEWVGDQKATADVMSKIGELSMQAARAKANAQEKRYAWEGGGSANNAAGGDSNAFLSQAIKNISD